MLKQRHQFFVVLLALADAVMVFLACLAAWVLRSAAAGHGLPAAINEWFRAPTTLLAVPVTLYAMLAFGLYRPRRDRSLMTELGQILKASLTAVVVLIVGSWALGGVAPAGITPLDAEIRGMRVDAGRIEVGMLAAFLPACLTIERLAFRAALRSMRRRGWNLRQVGVIGTGRLARVACRTLDRNSWTGIHVAYFISHNEHFSPGSMCLGRPVLGGLADIETVFELHKPDAVYIALPVARTVARPSILRRLERFPVDVRVIPEVQPNYIAHSMSVHELDGMPILSVRESPTLGLGGIAKRFVDLIGAAFGLVILAPLMLVIAALIRRSGPGPIIFSQRRVSAGGHVFNILKFRTMFHAEDEQGPIRWTSRDDSRITPIGRWLRKSSLDELPQLFNVFAGEMSLVGPRPERPELIEKFREDWRGYMLRQHVKAGITGWAQVNGFRGNTSLKKRLQHDLYYVRHWSLGFDLKILWLTLFRGFAHRNAH
ncbi:MAG: undecaprenyl-phosphate glucose phosphotransferase [bacterium]|nr:undecaprenyl-phosphate glucose phosphotransferase [bacterium]